MHIDDLEWQRIHSAGIPPRIVDAILECDGLEALVDAAREREDWFCAEGAVRRLCETGAFGRAWAVIEPFAATGWQPAVRTGADVLVKWGRVDQAVELAYPEGPDGEPRDTWSDYAEVLVGAGRVDEAIEALVPDLRDGLVLRVLVRMTEGQGRDERVLELLAPIAEEFRRGAKQFLGGRLWPVLPAQAQVLERSDRADEAIALLGADVAARRYGPENTVEFYAELLARHGRIEELRKLARGKRATVARRYVTALEDLGRAGEAEAFLRDLIGTDPHPDRYASALLELLARHGRFDEAVAAVAHTFDDLHESLLQPAMLLLAEHGHPDRALELTEGRSAEFIEESRYWLPSNRWWLMGEVGRCGEAIAEIEALQPDEVDNREVTIAGLLAKDGRLEEAMARLRACPGNRAAIDLARLLVGQGRCAEAIAAIPDVAAQREEERLVRASREQHW